MADLSISQIIQESLIEEKQGVPGYKANARKIGSGIKGLGGNIADSARSLGNKAKHYGGIARDYVANKASAGYQYAKTKAAEGAAYAKANPGKTALMAAGAGGIGYAAYKNRGKIMSAAKGLYNKATGNTGVKGFMKRHGGKVAAGSLAAIGAGVGAKALLKYLRKKKKNG